MGGHKTEQHTDRVRITVKQLDVPVLKISRPYPQLGISHFSSESLASCHGYLPLSPSIPLIFFFSVYSQPSTYQFISCPFSSLFISSPWLLPATPQRLCDQTHPWKCVRDKGFPLSWQGFYSLSQSSDFSPAPPHTTLLLQQYSLDVQQPLLALFWIKGWMSLALTSVCYLAQASASPVLLPELLPEIQWALGLLKNFSSWNMRSTQDLVTPEPFDLFCFI